MILVVIVYFFKKIVETYSFVYFVILKNTITFVCPLLIKIGGNATYLHDEEPRDNLRCPPRLTASTSTGSPLKVT